MYKCLQNDANWARPIVVYIDFSGRGMFACSIVNSSGTDVFDVPYDFLFFRLTVKKWIPQSKTYLSLQCKKYPLFIRNPKENPTNSLSLLNIVELVCICTRLNALIFAHFLVERNVLVNSFPLCKPTKRWKVRYKIYDTKTSYYTNLNLCWIECIWDIGLSSCGLSKVCLLLRRILTEGRFSWCGVYFQTHIPYCTRIAYFHPSFHLVYTMGCFVVL